MLKITSLKVIGNKIELEFDNSESAVVYKFGNTLYSTVSDGLNKSSLNEFKSAVYKLGFDEEKLKKIYLYEK